MATLTVYMSKELLDTLTNNDLDWYVVFDTVGTVPWWYLDHESECANAVCRLQCTNGDDTIYAEGEEIEINY